MKLGARPLLNLDARGTQRRNGTVGLRGVNREDGDQITLQHGLLYRIIDHRSFMFPLRYEYPHRKVDCTELKGLCSGPCGCTRSRYSAFWFQRQSK